MIGRILVLASTLIFWPALPVWGGYANDVLSDGPVAYWRLNEREAGDVLVDTTGNVGNGSYIEGAGLAFQFPGALVGDDDTATQFATTVGFGCGDCGVGQVPVGGPLDLGTLQNASITLEAWFKILPNTNASLPGSHFNRIFHYNNGAGGQYAFGIVGDNSADFPDQRTVFAGIGHGGGSGGIIKTAPSDSIVPSDEAQWYHFVATIDDSTVGLFLNGQPITTLNDSDPISWQATQATIGGRIQNNGSRAHPFPGLIDELAIYPKILSADRIAAHYQSGISEGILGDANGDGTIDRGDVVILVENFGPAIAGGFSVADFDADGNVGLTDAAIIQGAFDSTAPSAVAVPEPTALTLLMAGTAALLAGRRRGIALSRTR